MGRLAGLLAICKDPCTSEVMTYGSTDLALLYPATQSAPSSPTEPDKAVDGFNNTVQDVANNLYCTHVETVGQPVPGWWQVDRQVTVRVGSARITPAQYQSAIFMQIPEKKFDLKGPVEMETRSTMDCARSCLQLGSCPAFNYRSDSRVCEVSSNGNSSGLTAGNPVWDAYELDLCLDN